MNHTTSPAKLHTTFHHALWLCVMLALLTGCVATPTKQEPAEQGHVFYPALPNPPRIQYLTSFSSSLDVNQEKAGGFADFVLGKDKYKDAIPINKPYGVKLFDGKLYVADIRGAGYDILDLANKQFRYISGDRGGNMPKPINITIDTDGTKYITDTERNQVLVYDIDEHFVHAFGVKGQFKPVDTAIAGDKLFVADLQDNEIEVLNKHTGVLLYKIGKEGGKEGELFHPTNLKIGQDEHLYVSETGNFRVQKFTLDGRHVRFYGSVGLVIGQFARPKGIALDRAGRLYIVDAAFENVQIFDPDGKLLLFFGEAGDKPQNINLPADIEIDYDNVRYFQRFAHPDFQIEYIILISSHFGSHKVDAYGFGKMKEMDYPD